MPSRCANRGGAQAGTQQLTEKKKSFKFNFLNDKKSAQKVWCRDLVHEKFKVKDLK